MPTHLIKRRNNWYVRVCVPRPLRSILGREDFVRTTGTSDLKIAERRKHAIIADLRDEIDLLVNNDPSRDDWLRKQALGLRRAVSRGDIDAQLASDIIHDLRDRSSAPDDFKVHATRLASDTEYMPLSDLIETYLDDKKTTVTPSTLHKKSTELTALSQWLPAGIELSDVDRKVSGRYLASINGRSLAVRRIVVGILSAFWNYELRRGHCEMNPWMGLQEDLKGSRRGNGQGHARRPWTDAELKVIDTIDHDDPMYHILRIAQYTACRLNEICEMKTEHVTDEMMIVTEAKNQNSVRQIPLSSAIRELVARLVETSTDGYLIPGLKPGGLDGRRGHAVGKRLGRFIRAHVTTDKAVVTHSLRNTWITKAEQSGIPEHTVAQIAGHARQSLTYGLYSKGIGFELMQEAVEKIRY